MSLFGLFAKKPAELDPAEGNPHVGPSLAALDARDGDAFGRLYAGLQPADRFHVLDGIGQLTEIGASLPPLESHPAMAAISGALHYVWAHRLRGFATADLTSDQQVMDMAAMVAVAGDLLEAAAERTPGDSTVHGFRLRALMLTGGPEETFEAISRDLAATGEANVFAELARLNYLAPKWYGSVEAMQGFADAAISKPPNAAYLALKARAVIEEWLYETAMNDDVAATVAFREKLKSPAFRKEIGALDDRFRELFNSGAPLSVAEAGLAHNNFAVLFTLLGDKPRLKPHLSAIGAAVFSAPWAYIGGGKVPRLVARMRAECGLPKLPA